MQERRLMQERRNSIANTLELRLSCTNPLICSGANIGWTKFVILLATTIQIEVTLDISGNPIESQWGSQKYPG